MKYTNWKRKIYFYYAKLFAKKKFKKMNMFFFNIGLRGLGILNHTSFKISGEEFLFKKIQKMKPSVIFDVGANVGGYSKMISEYCSESIIYSFEPNPHAFKKIKNNLSKSENIKIYNFGFGKTTEERSIFTFANNPESGLTSLHKEALEGLCKNDKIIEEKIKLRRIDDFLSENNINEIDLLKIDTEGHEMAVLNGAKNSIESSKIKIIHFEFNEMNVVSRVFMSDFIKLLNNYDLFRLLPNELLPINNYSPLIKEIFAYQNIVAIRKDVLKSFN